MEEKDRWFKKGIAKQRPRRTPDITSVAKDRKAPSGGKSRTREADDAAIFA
jgi:hypothetical protein